YANKVSWYYRPLNEGRMREAAQYLIGEHDFSSYRAVACQAKNPVRNVHRLEVTRHGEMIVIDIFANAFLHHMVRNIAGVLMTIGSGEREPIWAKEVLEARDRTLGGVTATPHGLTLMGVEYPERFYLPRLTPNPPVW
ncbi:MAG: tRNA pseudouridine synthase A, partial [Gammaproteobacteria bacterium]